MNPQIGVQVITAEPEYNEATTLIKGDVLVKKLSPKGKGKKGAAITANSNK